MAFSPLGPQKPTMHVKGKPPQRSSQPPKNPIGPELGTLPVGQRAGQQRGHGGIRESKARIGVDFNTATSMWGGYKKATEAMIKAKGTPDYQQLSEVRESQLSDLHSKVSPQVAKLGKGWGAAAINAAGGNRQMAQFAEQADAMVSDFIQRGAAYAEGRRLQSNPDPSPKERKQAQTKALHADQAQKKRDLEARIRSKNIKQRKNDGS